jgi:ketosteroid isomerase-like protein
VEEMARTWFQALNAWEGFRSEPQEFIAHGPHVLVRNHITARGRESGLDVDADTASLFTLEDGKVVRLGLYWDVERARRAAGLDPDAG